MSRREWIAIILVTAAALPILLWSLLAGYINPTDATGRKNTVQVFALIVAGVGALITAGVSFRTLYYNRKNLEQQQAALQLQSELEEQRAQESVLQAYYEQIGQLLTEHDLLTTDREAIRLLVRAQTLTVLRRLHTMRKAAVVTFLYGARLINRSDPIVNLEHSDLSGVNLDRVDLGQVEQNNIIPVYLKHCDLSEASLVRCNLENANLEGANLSGANLYRAKLSVAALNKANLSKANLRHAGLQGANLDGADLRDAALGKANLIRAELCRADLTGASLSGAVSDFANLEKATVTEEQLQQAQSLRYATIPNGERHPL